MGAEARGIYFAQNITATLLGWLSAVPYLLPPSRVSAAPFLHVTPPSYRVSCPHLSQGPKRPRHGLQKDSQEAETEQTETSPSLGSVPVPLGRVCEEREGTKPQGLSVAGQKECWGGVSGSAKGGFCHPSVLPTMLPKPLQGKVYLPRFKTMLVAVAMKPSNILFLSHSWTSSQQLFLDSRWLSSNAVI